VDKLIDVRRLHQFNNPAKSNEAQKKPLKKGACYLTSICAGPDRSRGKDLTRMRLLYRVEMLFTRRVSGGGCSIDFQIDFQDWTFQAAWSKIFCINNRLKVAGRQLEDKIDSQRFLSRVT
jgi:hypothetical protein